MSETKTTPAVKTPVITVDGKKHKAIPPKARAWRDFVTLYEGVYDIAPEDYLDKMAECIAGVFDDDITADVVIDNTRVDEIKPLFDKCLAWISALVSGRLSEIPNGEAETV